MKSKYRKSWTSIFVLTVLFLAVVFLFPYLEQMLVRFFPGKAILVSRATLFELTVQHLTMVLLSSILSLLAAISLGIFAILPAGREFRDLLVELATFGETFPSVAIIALAVPALGYGMMPTLVALFIYGILPILRNTITGIENIPAGIIDAAYGTGMSRWQVLTKVELPLALPVIVAGIRTSVIINISAATIGATVGAGGLGVPIISGIRSYNPVLIIKGSVPVAILAVLADNLLGKAEELLV
jgi:osmoprotectant transport system permease protein